MTVYQAAVTFVGIAEQVAQSLPAGRRYLTDQLRRASTSIPLNVAEGAGEFSRADKARFYRIARRSATECAAILDVLRSLGLGDPRLLMNGKATLSEIVAMLIALSRHFEGQGPTEGEGRGRGSGKGGGGSL